MKKNKGGRPPSLIADQATLNTVKGLGSIQATTRECAAVLGVTEPTYITFKQKYPKVAEAYESGSGGGLASLRRRQFKAAQDGNATMLIWLGKQYLGQRDMSSTELGGPNGGAIPIRLTNLSDAQLVQLLTRLSDANAVPLLNAPEAG